ncbi:MAG: MFS transporter [Clostridia bacterium]|nr:MFS transporter [Clostridia bacterium]
MNKLTSKRDINFLTFLFALTYMVSYITRINYGAIIVEMETATGISKSMLSMALTGSFITYGTGQVISGIIGDRISPKRLVSIGLCVTVLMNLAIPFSESPYLMLAVWCINGFAQSLMWPPLVRLMTTLLSAEDYKNAATKVSWGSSFGTIAVYLLSPVLISISGWKSVFFFSALLGLVMIFIWNKFSYEIGIKKREKQEVEVDNSKKYRLLTPLMLFVLFAIVLQGMLRDGVTTWMPSYIKDTYNLGNTISILTGVVLPVFSIFCFGIATKLYQKVFTNPITCACLFFFVGTASALGIYILAGKSAILSILCSAILTGSMHGVNLMLVCMIPPYFEKSGRVSTVSGIINSCTYIGSAISTYGIAILSEKLGWNFTVLVWIIIAAFGALICFLCKSKWKRRFATK